MTFEIKLSARAEEDLNDILTQIRMRAPLTVDNWYTRLIAAIDALKILPTRYGRAEEAADLRMELRELLHGKWTSTYRVLFTMTGQTVRILHVRRASRGPITLEDLS